MTAYIGMGAATDIPAGSRVRIVYGKKTSLFDDVTAWGSYDPNDLFVKEFPNVQDRLTAVGNVTPTTFPKVPQGTSVAVVEGRTKRATTGAGLDVSLQSTQSAHVQLTSIQLLAGAEAANITNASGAAARDAAAAAALEKQKAEAAAGDPFARLAEFFGTTMTVLKWTAVVVVLLAIVYAFVEYEKHKS